MSLGFYVLFLIGKVGGLLESIGLKFLTQAKDSMPQGGNIVVIKDTLSSGEYLQNFTDMSETIIEEGGCLTYCLGGGKGTQDLSFIGLDTWSIMTY